LISARRVAREWALKILYQSDVGKAPIAESLNAALDRLRQEFVQRASRVAAGSALEEQLADAVTAHLRELLPQFDSSVEPLLHECFARIADAAGAWTEFEVNMSVSRQSFNALWEVPKRKTSFVLPSSIYSSPIKADSNRGSGSAETDWAERFLRWASEALPSVAMAAYAREIRLARPQGAKLKETHEFVVNEWTRFGLGMAHRWRAAIGAAEKQTGDWLRVAAFTLKLVEGVSANREAIDRSLESREIGWSLDRQVSVDRSILRMAAFELLYLESIPASATINEAVELAKKYSTAESGKFVNGILGAIVTEKASSGSIAEPDDAIDFREDAIDALVDTDEVTEEEPANV
jgi:N utilization substance protein B